MQEQIIALIVGIFILLFALETIRGKKQFGKDIAKVTEMTMDLLFGIIKGVYNFAKKNIFNLCFWIKSKLT